MWRLHLRTEREMAERFEEAFGVALGAPYPEVEKLYRDRFGVDVCGHLAVFAGVTNRDVETFLDESGNEITDLTGTSFELCRFAMEHFLAKHQASKYNTRILDAIVTTRGNLLLMRAMLANRQEFEALHFLLGAKSALGHATALIDFREEQRAKGKKGGAVKGSNGKDEDRRIIEIYLEKIPPGTSIEKAAQDLQLKCGVGSRSHRHLTRLISRHRREAKEPIK